MEKTKEEMQREKAQQIVKQEGSCADVVCGSCGICPCPLSYTEGCNTPNYYQAMEKSTRRLNAAAEWLQQHPEAKAEKEGK